MGKQYPPAFAGGYVYMQLVLLPVVPDVLHIIVIFHDVDELFHSKPSVSGETQGKHWKITLFKFERKFRLSTNSVIPS